MTDQKQGQLLDTEHPAHKEIVAACRELKAARDQRLAYGREETKVQEKLLVLLHEHDLKEFDGDGVHAEIVVEKEKVKVKIQSSDEADDDDGD